MISSSQNSDLGEDPLNENELKDQAKNTKRTTELKVWEMLL